MKGNALVFALILLAFAVIAVTVAKTLVAAFGGF